MHQISSNFVETNLLVDMNDNCRVFSRCLHSCTLLFEENKSQHVPKCCTITRQAINELQRAQSVYLFTVLILIGPEMLGRRLYRNVWTLGTQLILVGGAPTIYVVIIIFVSKREHPCQKQYFLDEIIVKVLVCKYKNFIMSHRCVLYLEKWHAFISLVTCLHSFRRILNKTLSMCLKNTQ